MFKFGDIVENGWASERNPTRRGFVVRMGNRKGRMNAGPYVEMTDGKGKFWECPITKDHKLTKVGHCPINEMLNPPAEILSEGTGNAWAVPAMTGSLPVAGTPTISTSK